MRANPLFSTLCFWCLSIFLSCSTPLQPNLKPVSADYCIYLGGKVLKKDGTPLKNVTVRFNVLPYSDSTDSSGRYLIKLRKDSASSVLNRVLSDGSYTDTLSFIKNGQAVYRQKISTWKDTLQDVIVAEIKISVDFGSNAVPLLKTEAVIARQNSPAAADDRTIDLSRLPPTHRYESFVYLVHQSSSPSYALYVNTYGLDSVLLGRSKTITFSAQDNAVPVPFFNPRNAVPQCYAGVAQRIGVNDTFRLKGTAIDSFGVIAKWEWDVGGTGAWTEVTPDSGITGVAPPKARKNFPCILRVTNDKGAIARDTVLLQIEPDAPVLTVSAARDTVSINDTIQLLATVSDSFGKIVTWEWDAGNTGYFVNKTPDSSFFAIAPDTAMSAYPCVLKVTDDDGTITLDTVFIRVVKDAPIPRAIASKTTVSINDTVKLLGTAHDGFGHIVSWEWDAGKTGAFVNTTPDSGLIVVAPDTATGRYPCILRVTDDDGNVASDTVTITVLLDPPVPKAAAAKTTVSTNDTIRLLGSAHDGFGKIVSWEWEYGNTGYFENTTPDSNLVVSAPGTPTGNYPCVLRVTDDDGNVAMDTVTITVLLDPPVPKAAAAKTMVSINDTIHLLGTAHDGFGHIVSWEWEIGNSGYFVDKTPDSNCIAIAPDVPVNAYPCVLRVTDDDGNVAMDTVTITVLLDPPVPKAAAAKTTVSINDTIRLLGTAHDGFGKIVSWEWDVGGSGTFIETTPDSGYLATAPDTANADFPCILRVTDDDGNRVMDTVSIAVTLPQVLNASPLTAINRKSVSPF